jgi:FkbM family methyltransferase
MIRASTTRLRTALGPSRYGRLKQTLDRFLFRYRRHSHAQFGEDLFLTAYFAGQDGGIYVDVGAFHPRQFSNTALLSARGWRGLNIDATPGSMRLFDALRPRDENLEAVVSDEPGPTRLHSWGLHAENTTAPEQAHAVAAAKGPPHEILDVESRTLTEILDSSALRGARIDLLTIDAEGSDRRVLHSLDWSRYRPRVVVTELYAADIDAVLASERYAFLRKHGYRLVSWHRPSLIFEHAPDPVHPERLIHDGEGEVR